MYLRGAAACRTAATMPRQLAVARVATVESPELASWAAPVRPRYVLGELLGSGTAASVFVGTNTASGMQAAVKRLPKWRNGRERTQLIKDEV
jgi:hypothetical protein